MKEKEVVQLDDVNVPGAGTSTTGGEGADDGHHPSERRNRWFDYPITTLSPTVDHADNRVDDEAMMA